MIIIKRRKEIYKRTESGKNWKSKPDSVTEEIITEKFFRNFVESISFFNRFGNGAYCRANKAYTYIGFVPVKVVTVSPGRTEKHIDTFTFSIEH